MMRPMPFAPVYTCAEVRELEAAAQAQDPSPTLMQRAGLAAAERAMSILQATARAVLVVAGPGNNGGDAFEVATILKQKFHRVEALFMGEREKLSSDAADALRRWQSAGGSLISTFPAHA